jgi:hypothetical protein
MYSVFAKFAVVGEFFGLVEFAHFEEFFDHSEADFTELVALVFYV